MERGKGALFGLCPKWTSGPKDHIVVPEDQRDESRTSDSPSALESSSREMMSSLGGASWTGALGSNLALMVADDDGDV
jgi:hypothetical protein